MRLRRGAGGSPCRRGLAPSVATSQRALPICHLVVAHSNARLSCSVCSQSCCTSIVGCTHTFTLSLTSIRIHPTATGDPSSFFFSAPRPTKSQFACFRLRHKAAACLLLLLSFFVLVRFLILFLLSTSISVCCPHVPKSPPSQCVVRPPASATRWTRRRRATCRPTT